MLTFVVDCARVTNGFNSPVTYTAHSLVHVKSNLIGQPKKTTKSYHFLRVDEIASEMQLVQVGVVFNGIVKLLHYMIDSKSKLKWHPKQYSYL